MSGRGRATLWVFGGILLGRIIGYGRELSISSTFGLSGMGDVVQAGLTIPDIMFNLLVGGAVGGALIPEFTRRSPEERNGLHRTASIWLGSVLMVVALLASIWPAPLATLVASGFKALEKTELLIQLVRGLVFVVPVTAVAAVTRAYLHAHQRFASASVSAFIYNLGLVVGVVLMGAGAPLEVIVIAALGGALAAWLVQLAESRIVRVPEVVRVPLESGLFLRYGQALLVGALIFVMPVLAKSAASHFGEGSWSIMHYAIKLIELPLGTVLTVLSVVLLPSFAERLETHREDTLALAGSALRVTLMLAVAIAAPLAIFSQGFATLLFGYGAMGPDGARRVGELAAPLVVAMAGQAVLSLLTSLSHAQRDMVSPVVASVIALGAGVATWFLTVPMGVTSIAVAYAVTFAVLPLVLMALLHIRHRFDLVASLSGMRYGMALAMMCGLAFLASVGVRAWVLTPLAQVGVGLGLGAVMLGVGIFVGQIRPDVAQLRGAKRQNQTEPAEE
jgi:murein biosynthesis integral membrane protein MurJ